MAWLGDPTAGWVAGGGAGGWQKTLGPQQVVAPKKEVFYFLAKNDIIPVISSRAGGRKFQKEKETIGRSDALLIFAPDTHVLQWSAISLNARIPPIKLESLLLIIFL